MADLPDDAIPARSEIARLLNSLASALGANLETLSRPEQLTLFERALDIRASFRKRAERFQAYFVPSDE